MSTTTLPGAASGTRCLTGLVSSTIDGCSAAAPQAMEQASQPSASSSAVAVTPEYSTTS